MTICSTIYFDLDDAEVLANNWSPRYHPVWAFSDPNGKINMSFYLTQAYTSEQTKEAASLSISILEKSFYLGKLQLSNLFYLHAMQLTKYHVWFLWHILKFHILMIFGI